MPRSNARSAPQLLTPNEAAELLSVSPRTIANWISADQIPYVTLPSGTHRVPLHALLSSLGGNYDLSKELQAEQAEYRSDAGSRAGVKEPGQKAGADASRPRHRAAV